MGVLLINFKKEGEGQGKFTPIFADLPTQTQWVGGSSILDCLKLDF